MNKENKKKKNYSQKISISTKQIKSHQKVQMVIHQNREKIRLDIEKIILPIAEHVQIRYLPNIKFLHYLSIFHASLCSLCSEEHGVSLLWVYIDQEVMPSQERIDSIVELLDHSIQGYSEISKNDCDYLFKQALTRTYLG